MDGKNVLRNFKLLKMILKQDSTLSLEILKIVERNKLVYTVMKEIEDNIK